MNFVDAMTPISQAVFWLAFVATAGLLLGNIKYRGIGLGSAGVLFAGLAFAHAGATVDETVLDFAKEFGLILFVFTVGIQLGPGIIDLWRQHGFVLNLLAAAIVVIGLLLTVGMTWMFGIEGDAGVGLFSGATTNTPSLGAAQQALMQQSPEGGASRSQTLALSYAVAYPGAIVGIIGTILLLKRWLKVDLKSEAAQLRSNGNHLEPLQRRNLVVTNPNLSGLTISQIPGQEETSVMISRVWRQDEDLVHRAFESAVIQTGDVILAVGTTEALDKFQLIVGEVTDKDLMTARGDAQFRRVVVTNKKILGKSLRELALDHMWGVTVTRVIRSGVEMTANGSTRVHFGDLLQIVGNDDELDYASRHLGNSPADLNETQFIPFFVGITLGVICGLIPLSLPGLSQPVKLGLAGGPLIVAIAFSLLGNLGPLVWYIPANANRAIRELGIVLFLACVGLHAGGKFVETVLTSEGVRWLIAGAIITILPLVIVGCIARFWLKLNFLTLSGLIAGSMTDPPALAFAGSLSDSEGASVAYAAVYPIAMTLRIVSAQILVLILCAAA